MAGIKVAQTIKNKIIKRPRLHERTPEMGQKEDNPLVINRGFRYLVEGNYKIVYNYYSQENTILISAVFDTRQNPTKLNV